MSTIVAIFTFMDDRKKQERHDMIEARYLASQGKYDEAEALFRKWIPNCTVSRPRDN